MQGPALCRPQDGGTIDSEFPLSPLLPLPAVRPPWTVGGRGWMLDCTRWTGKDMPAGDEGSVRL